MQFINCNLISILIIVLSLWGKFQFPFSYHFRQSVEKSSNYFQLQNCIGPKVGQNQHHQQQHHQHKCLTINPLFFPFPFPFPSPGCAAKKRTRRKKSQETTDCELGRSKGYEEGGKLKENGRRRSRKDKWERKARRWRRAGEPGGYCGQWFCAGVLSALKVGQVKEFWFMYDAAAVWGAWQCIHTACAATNLLTQF